MKLSRTSACVVLLAVACVPDDHPEKPKQEPQKPGATAMATREAPPKPGAGRLDLPAAPATDGSARRRPSRLSLAPRGMGSQPSRPGSAAPTPTPPQPAATAALREAMPGAPIKEEFFDFFDRSELGPEYNATAPAWRITGGRLCGQGAKNHPIWLNRKLPVNARIEFDATSTSPDGDLKVEVWGDGKSHAKGNSYNDATSYIAIFGGWKNQFHVLARLDEHDKARPEVRVDRTGAKLNARPVQPNRSYHFKLERSDGKTIRWFVDDIEILNFTDPEPLKGEGHEYLGFNDWDAPVCFDNLRITPLGGG